MLRPVRNVKPGDHSADRRMILLSAMAVIVGLLVALGAWVLLKMIAFSTNLFWYQRFSFQEVEITDANVGLWVLAIPVIGALIIGIMARFGSEKIRGHGIPEAMETILYGESRLSPKIAILKPVSAAISLGSGGPFGAEGPIIMTGGAIGSLFAQLFQLSAAERKTLLAAGAAGGMAAIFGTPTAAVLLAVELLLFEWKPRSFLPVVIAVLVAFTARDLWVEPGPMFPALAEAPHLVWTLPGAALLGAVIGLFAAAITVSLYRIEDLFERLPIHWMWWPVIGAIFVGGGGLIDPRVLGPGYANIHSMLSGDPTSGAIILLLIAKSLVWLIALGSGTSGGVLAPLVMLGGAVGWLSGLILPGEPSFWTLVGMAGIISAAMRGPMTGVLFAVEITGRFDALPVVVACAAIAYGCSVLLTRQSILTEKIARRGRYISHEYGVDPLEILKVSDVMTASPVTLPGDMTIGAALEFFAHEARHRSYPVIDGDRRLLGVVSRTDALSWQSGAFDHEASLADTVSDQSQASVVPDTTCSEAADVIVSSGFGRIPVVDPTSGVLVGLLARQDLLRARHARRSQDSRRSRFQWQGPQKG